MTTSAHTYYFEKLEVWQFARVFVKKLYCITQNFPEEEKYGFTSQMRRSAISITANIAEGFSRNTAKDKARFINQAYSSAIEILNFTILASDLEYISDSDKMEIRSQISFITNKLNALHKALTIDNCKP